MICRLASAQGIGLTFPESNSSIRRAISCLHDSSADASTESSRLSKSDPANAARASAGRASALCSNSETSLVMPLFYSRGGIANHLNSTHKFISASAPPHSAPPENRAQSDSNYPRHRAEAYTWPPVVPK